MAGAVEAAVSGAAQERTALERMGEETEQLLECADFVSRTTGQLDQVCLFLDAVLVDAQAAEARAQGWLDVWGSVLATRELRARALNQRLGKRKGRSQSSASTEANNKMPAVAEETRPAISGAKRAKAQ